MIPWRPGVLAVSLLWLLAGCTPQHAHVAGTPPWADGEQATYDRLSTTAARTQTHRTSRAEGGTWMFAYSSSDGASGNVIVDGSVAPLVAHHHVSTFDIDVTYATEISLIAGPPQKTATSPRFPDTVDAEAFYWTLRALPLAEGFQRQLSYYAPAPNKAYDVTVRVVGTETVTVPAGTFDTWHVTVSLLDGYDAWIARAAPHWLVKQAHPGAGTELRLRSYRADKAAPEVVSKAPAAEPRKAPAIPTSFFVASFLVQFPLMIGLPLVLAWRLGRRYRDWKPIALGAAAFVASQVVHIPLNSALGLIGGKPPLGTLPALPLSIVVGLSAGLCEEIARFLMMRFAMRERRGFQRGVLFGVGHGGVESLLFGVGALLGLVNVVLLPVLGADKITPEVTSQLAAYAAKAHPSSAVWAGLERVGAIAFHVGASVLVMRAVTRKNPLYLLAAIALHAAIDGGVIGLKLAGGGTEVIEVLAIVSGLAVLALGLALREPELRKAD